MCILTSSLSVLVGLLKFKNSFYAEYWKITYTLIEITQEIFLAVDQSFCVYWKIPGPLFFKIFQNLNSSTSTDFSSPITGGITDTCPSFPWSMPSFLHYNALTIRKAYGLKITMVRLGFEKMKKRMRPWEAWKENQKRTCQGLCYWTRRDLVIKEGSGAQLLEWCPGQVGRGFWFRATVQSTPALTYKPNWHETLTHLRTTWEEISLLYLHMTF